MKTLLYFLWIAFIPAHLSCMAQDSLSELKNEAATLNNEAYALIQKRQYEPALEKLISALELDPAQYETYINLSFAASNLGKHALTEKYLLNAKKVFEGDEQIAYYLANAYNKQEKLELAVEEYANAIKYGFNKSERSNLTYAYHLNRANCYFKLGKTEMAINDYTVSLNYKTNNPDALFNRGLAYLKNKNNTEACEDWKKARDNGMDKVNSYLLKYCN
jgi:tetratricopeptide (TPR) repeat protein